MSTNQLKPSDFLIRARSYMPKGVPETAVVSVECKPASETDSHYSYWVYLRTGYRAADGTHVIHEPTINRVRNAMHKIAYVENDTDGYGDPDRFTWQPSKGIVNADGLPEIGHLRGDFGRSGAEFWTSWFDKEPSLKTAAFREEFNRVVNDLRNNILRDFGTMRGLCREKGISLTADWGRECYGFQLETASCVYHMRCIPIRNDYNFYIRCFAKGHA